MVHAWVHHRCKRVRAHMPGASMVDPKPLRGEAPNAIPAIACMPAVGQRWWHAPVGGEASCQCASSTPPRSPPRGGVPKRCMHGFGFISWCKSVWSHANPCGCMQTHVDPCGSMWWAPPHGSMPICMGQCEWIHMNPCGFTGMLVLFSRCGVGAFSAIYQAR